MAIVEKKDQTVRLSDGAFLALSFPEKRSYLHTRSPKERMDLIIADPDGRRLAASMQPQEFFWLMKEIGETDAVELLDFASPEQVLFILDMELWDGWTFLEEKACHWLAYFVEGGEARVHELLKSLDFEFLQLFLGRELIVGGGIGDPGNDEERLADYDHTFDDVFFLTFKHPKHSRLIGTFLSMLVKLDNPLYTALMESIKGEIDLELEEQYLRFRSGRLQDLGFPPLEEALSIYGRVNPAAFEVSGDKVLQPAGEGGELVPLPPKEESLLYKALALAGSDTLLQELNYLVNSALVAEGPALHEPDGVTRVLQRVYGYLNIALEKLTDGDVEKAASLLTGEPLKRLFQLGFSLVLELKFTADRIKSADYASGKLINGLKSKRPRFYRGLDPDGIDGYREFSDLEDVKRVADLLGRLD